MIIEYKDGDALEATEKCILVPVAIDSPYIPSSGFVKSAMERFPDVRSRIYQRLPFNQFRPGEMISVRLNSGAVAELVALVGLHRHMARGWKRAPENLRTSLHQIAEQFGNIAIATASIPGTGFSGVKGGAESEKIRAVLEETDHSITVYQRRDAFDREPRTQTEPLKSEATSLKD